jgi:hypothetical protein
MLARTCFAAVSLLSLATTARAQEPSAYMTPTREHQQLAREVGVWDAETTTWADANATPEKGKGVETNYMVGAMWLSSAFEGEFMGQKFTGQMQLGYDPIKKKYIGTWLDSISPFLFAVEGEYDVATHTLTCMMTGTSAMTGQPETAKNVTRYIDDGNKVFEMYMPVEGQDGQWWKMMEIKYTRRK